MKVLIQPEDGGTFEYIKDIATMICDKGSLPSQIKASPKVLKLNRSFCCSTIDKDPVRNNFNFGICAITQKPCSGCISLRSWQDFKKDTYIGSHNALIDKSTIGCATGGKIQFINSGQ